MVVEKFLCLGRNLLDRYPHYEFLTRSDGSSDGSLVTIVVPRYIADDFKKHHGVEIDECDRVTLRPDRPSGALTATIYSLSQIIKS